MPMTLTQPLGDGTEIPRIGFGTYLISEADAPRTVGDALDAGYRHIDTAEIYGNEAGIGIAIAARLARGEITREELFVTTKLWPGNPARGEEPKSVAATIASCDGSLERLGLDFVDLYLIHAPFHPEYRIEQWRGLLELQKAGKTRAIGVSNFNAAHLEELRAAGLPLPAANQIELHPWSQKRELVAFLAENRITPIAYSSLAPLSTWRIAEGQKSGKTAAMQRESERQDSPFRVLAQKYGVTEARVLLRWGVQQGFPVLPKSSDRIRLRQNLDLFSFSIDDDDMRAIARMDRGDGVAWASGDPTDLA